MRAVLPLIALPLFSAGLLLPATALADNGGAPPPDDKALVAAPKATEEVPKLTAGSDATTATVSAGGQLATGNSRLFATTANGKLDIRRGANGFGAAIIGNYGETAATPNAPLVTTTESFQGRLRYDRYVLDRMSIFLIGTVRHDKFQGLDGRLNVDPGIKYLMVMTYSTVFWFEVGYDFQYDARNGSALVQLDANGDPIPGAPPLPQTATDQSARAYLGFRHAFNSAVTFVTGLEYLQSFYSSENTSSANYDYRFNYDALFAANVGAGFSLGVGFTARYDNVPLPGKVNWDTITTLNLIFSFSDAAPPPPTCPCPAPTPPPIPPPPSSSAPSGATPSAPPPATPNATPPSTSTPPSTATPGAPSTPPPGATPPSPPSPPPNAPPP